MEDLVTLESYYRGYDHLGEGMFGEGDSPQVFWSKVHPASCDVTVMRYIGIKDRDKKRIYEGDILEMFAEFSRKNKHPRKIGPLIKVYGVVRFYAGFWPHDEPRFICEETKMSYDRRIHYGNATDWYRTYRHFEHCKVLGNIFENPEILENETLEMGIVPDDEPQYKTYYGARIAEREAEAKARRMALRDR